MSQVWAKCIAAGTAMVWNQICQCMHHMISKFVSLLQAAIELSILFDVVMTAHLKHAQGAGPRKRALAQRAVPTYFTPSENDN